MDALAVGSDTGGWTSRFWHFSEHRALASDRILLNAPPYMLHIRIYLGICLGGAGDAWRSEEEGANTKI